MAVILVFAPIFAHANLLSTITNFFSNPQKTETLTQKKVNSQNLEILEASVSPSGTDSRGGADVNIVDDTLLEPDQSPLGNYNDDGKLNNGQISIYVVRKGDTLSEIAQMFDVTTNTIIWANDLTNGVITEGQILVILPVNGIKHVAKSGDTLQSIAKKYSGDVNEILKYNNITIGTKLSAGDEIIVPQGEIAVQQMPTSKTFAPVPQSVWWKIGLLKVWYKEYPGYYKKPLANYTKTQGLHGYNGVDLANSIGTPVMASASGQIIIAKNSGWNAGYGNYIVISHGNDTQTLYGHLSEVDVNVGDYVMQGQVIGKVGTTGRSTGAHLHFEVRGAKNPF